MRDLVNAATGLEEVRRKEAELRDWLRIVTGERRREEATQGDGEIATASILSAFLFYLVEVN